MPTLHIEHAITDFASWRAAFERFADVRARYGVRAHQVRRPVDDPCHVVIDLDFDTDDEARRFLDLLVTSVWSSPRNAPALVGVPRTSILRPAPTAG